jgi:prepilin-type N-terminal cleavage/methylation domain-containing protein
MKKYSAFTLIELLIVVAIIAILAAIAVPNFLDAQVRSRVARVQSDMRMVATAIEAYRIDNNTYPVARNAQAYCVNDSNANFISWGSQNCNNGVIGLSWDTDWNGKEVRYSWAVNTDGSRGFRTLTTPTAYITSYPVDAFADTPGLHLGYTNLDNKMWVVWSYGPDGDELADGQMGGDRNDNIGGYYWVGFNPPAPSLCLDRSKGDNSYATNNGNWDNPLGGAAVIHTYSGGNPTKTLLTAGYTYDGTNGSKSGGDIWRLR